MKSFTPTDLPELVAHATSRCGIDSNDLMITDPSIAFPRARLLSDFFISLVNSVVFTISPRCTISGLGFGNWIPTQSVHGIGATIRTDLDLSDKEISLDNHSIIDNLIPSSGLILICTMEGPISNHSIMIGTSNSINLFCNALAFSMRNVSSIVTVCSALVSKIE